jgi:hypothetical protein
MLKNLRKRLGEMMKIVFGRNSATIRIIAVEMSVFRIRIKRSDSIYFANSGPRSLENTSP